jgi:hypothetical protein
VRFFVGAILTSLETELGDRTQELEVHALSNHKQEFMSNFTALTEQRQKTIENITRMESDIEFVFASAPAPFQYSLRTDKSVTFP